MRRVLISAACFAFGCSSPDPWRAEIPGYVEDAWATAPDGAWARQRQVVRTETAARSWEGVIRKESGTIAAEPERFDYTRAGPYDFIPRAGPHFGIVRATRDLGTEALTVGSRTYSCKVTETEIAWPHTCALSVGLFTAPTTRLRIWSSPDAPTPGGVLRWQASDFTGEALLEYAEVDGEAEVAGRRVATMRLAYRRRGNPDGSLEIDLLWSPQVPGLVVKYCSRERGDGPAMEYEVDTVEFGAPAD